MQLSLLRPAIIILAAAPLLAACSANASRFSQPEPPPPVLSAPTPHVSAQQLPPLGGQMTGNGGFGQPQRGQEQRMAALPPQTEPPTTENVLGQWSISSPGDSCQISVALTSWEGGYRASTRECTSPELTNVGAWNIEGNLLVLKDNQGNPLARLQRSGSTRFDGRLELGGAVTMSR